MTHEQQQPMSDARLAEIRELVQDYYHGDDPDIDAVMDLLADNERLRAREAAWVTKHEQAMAIVRAVAESYQPTKYSYGSVSHHKVEQARALLASADEAK